MTMLHTFLTTPPLRKNKTIEDVPDYLLIEWASKLFSLMNLTWGYVETICDLCIQMKLEPTKKLVRVVRNLKRDYDIFRSQASSSELEQDETMRGEMFEESFADDFNKLFTGLEHEVNKLDRTPEHKSLVIAVQQTLTLMDAVKQYARWCDKQISMHGVWVCDCCMVQTEFLKLYPIIPQFAGDCYQPDLPARKITVGILVNRLHQCQIVKKHEWEVDGNELCQQTQYQ